MKKEIDLTGKDYWRSLDQLADTPEFQDFLNKEFPENASEMNGKLSRRKFLTLMGASLAFAGLAGCRKPVEKIIPYVTAPENIVPGIPQFYATTMPLGLSNYGIVVESHEGRPTKIEGNEKHPSSLGKTNAVVQASIIGLYDPDRSKKVMHKGEEKTWKAFLSFWKKHQKTLEPSNGEGLAVLTESISSPTFYGLYEKFKKQYPKAKWYVYNPVSDENIYKGLELAVGKPYQPVYNYEKAKVILSLDSDFLLTENEDIKANLGFAAGRKISSEKDEMNRLYVVESSLSNTGALADHRLRTSSGDIAGFTVALVEELKRQGLKIEIDLSNLKASDLNFDKKWLQETVKDILKQRSSGLIVAGRRQPAIVHAMVYAINLALGNVGVAVSYKEISNTLMPEQNSIVRLSEEVNNNKISTLAILNGNPVYNSPSDINFKELLTKIKTTIHLSEYVDETSKLTTWHLPCSHFLESWGDAKSVDGTLSVVQPMIEPLYNGKSNIEVMHMLLSGKVASGHNLVRDAWISILPKNNFENKWRKVLHDGLLENSSSRSMIPSIKKNNLNKALAEFNFSPANLTLNNLEIVFQASPTVFDGRFANNGWLQELPDSMTKLVWDNAAIFSPKTAKELGVKNEDVVELTLKNKSIKLPVWILPGQADYSISVYLGYGRESVGRIGNNVGFNLYKIRNSKALYIDSGITVFKTVEKYTLANTQDHGSMEGRPLVREASLEEYHKNPEFAKEMVKHPPLVSLWEEPSYQEGYQWGMAIDLNACTGCNACAIACQSENNIPIIGKEHVRNGREMHWIRMDRYFSGNLEDPEVVFQPVACQHCENAPCEQVCPVAATSHDEEGLNVMTYNRCIGTRYCANNCPYKVRRFNFFNFTKDYPEVMKMAQNPDVTVRSRGVMEKCTYCTQRINSAKIKAKNEGRELKDGEAVAACQQTCPANAIVFGNINDPDSEVCKVKKQNRDYAMLGELNFKPRTTYLAKLRNPNPELGGWKTG